MQARSSSSGNLVTWVTEKPDFAASFWPGPGSPEEVAVVGGRLQLSPPGYYPIDSRSLLCWRFQEAAAPFANLGSLGSTYDMAAISGEGTVWLGGQPDGHFGKGLKFALETNADGAIRAPHSPWPSSEITISCWFTATRYVGANDIGRLFYKANSASVWSAPFHSASLQFGVFGASSGENLTVGIHGLAISESFNKDYEGIIRYPIHHVGFTYGDGFLRTYLDGELFSSIAAATPLNLGAGPWCIGTTPFTPLTENAGMILHEVRVCDVIRDAEWWRKNWERGRLREGGGSRPPVLTSVSPGIFDPTGGSVLTVTGTALANASSVYVDAFPCAILSNTGTTIVIQVPAIPAGTYSLVATTPGGTSNALSVESWAPSVTYTFGGWYQGPGYVVGTGTWTARSPGTATQTQAVAGQRPDNGPTFNGKISVDYVPANSDFQSRNSAQDHVGPNVTYWGWALFRADAISTNVADATVYNNVGIWSDSAGNKGVHLRSASGGQVLVYHYDSAGVGTGMQIMSTPYVAGTLVVVQWYWNSATGEMGIRTNKGAWSTGIRTGNPTGASNMILGRNFNSVYYDGVLLDIAFAGTGMSAPPASTAAWNKIVDYLAGYWNVSLP